MNTQTAGIVLVAVLATSLIGCTTHSDGDLTRATGTFGIPRFADLLPPRPRELDLTDVDPCTDPLTEQQLRDLNYDHGYARPPHLGRSEIHGGPVCTFASTGESGDPDRDIASLVGISTTEGALAWVTDLARAPGTRPEVITVQGYSALVLPLPESVNNCKVVVDTAEGQYLEVTSTAPSGKGTAAKPYCDEAARVADLAIHTISKSR